MLGKLYKYEWKATARLFIPFYIAMLVFSLINRVFLQINVQDSWLAIPAGMMMFAFVMITVATLALTVIIMIQRFYKNLMGDEGYLMFTLPVKPWQHIVSKLLIVCVWTFLSLFVVIIALLAMLGNREVFAEMSRIYNGFVNTEMPFNKWLAVAGLLVTLIASTIASILQVYAAIALGQLFAKHKLVASFGAYLVLNVVLQILVSLAFGLGYLAFPSAFVMTEMPKTSFFVLMFWGTMAINIITGAGFFFLTNYILKKRLNLQ